MSRKANISDSEKEKWNNIRVFAFNKGYGPIRSEPPPSTFAEAVVVLGDSSSCSSSCSSSLVSASSGSIDDACHGPLGVPMCFLPAVETFYESDAATQQFVVMDLSLLEKSLEIMDAKSTSQDTHKRKKKSKKRSQEEAKKANWKATIDAEAQHKNVLGKTIGRPLAKALQRLSLGSSGLTLVAMGHLSVLALKLALFQSTCSRASQSGISKLLLIEPVISIHAINDLIAEAHKENNGCNIELNVLYKNQKALEHRAPILRTVFQRGHDIALDEHQRVSDETVDHITTAFVSSCKNQSDAIALAKEFGVKSDQIGHRLWFQELVFEMNKHTKQIDRIVLEKTTEMRETFKEPKPTKAQEQKLENEVGALILRGNRCVLVRPPQKAKRDMFIPSVVPKEGETLEMTARRAIEVYCEIDVKDQFDQIEKLKSVLPFALYRHPHHITTIVPFVATQAPPPGPIKEDEDDWYDWYTLDLARKRVDRETIAALKTIAFSLEAARISGQVRVQWGGVFGQELAHESNDDLCYARAEQVESEEEEKEKEKEAQVSSHQKALEMVQTVKGTREKPIPVTVLSGFLGAGKTTLMKSLLENRKNMKIAVIVNDMADVNVDAALLKAGGSSVIQNDEKMVELSNGCICCTLREDLFSTLASLAADKTFDYVLVESSGISEPLPVAETFTFVDEETGISLSDVAQLDTLVSVVDASVFEHELGSKESLADRNWEVHESDERTISHLLVDQVEFANVVIINKCDLLPSPEALGSIKKLIQQLNPTAHIIETIRSKVDPSEILGTNRFSFEKAAEHPEWLVEARHGEHRPESIEYGISSFTFRSKRPLHPGRFKSLLDDACLSFLPRLMEAEPEVKIENPLSSIVRAKGIAYLAVPSCRDLQGTFSLAGRVASVVPGPPWWCTMDREDWPQGLEEEMGSLWDSVEGDRQNEIVVIGVNLDHEAVRLAFESCVLTDEEAKLSVEDWKSNFPDPFETETWLEHDHDHDHGHDHDDCDHGNCDHHN